MKPYSPVITPTQTASVWVPTLKNEIDDALIPGHLVFLKIHDSQWAYDIADDYDPHHFSNLRMVQVPAVKGERNDMNWKDAQGGRAQRVDNDVFSVPVTIGNKK